MRAALQHKINLLGVALILLFLLMLPAFSQVKADTRDSIKEAKNTLMVKWLREVAKDIKPPKNLEDVEVEDYWEEQAKRYDPECGELCDPKADRDGDGVSNGDEYRQGRNPSCNEDKYGHEYCQGRDKFNLTDEDPTQNVIRVTLLRDLWLNVTQSPSCASGPVVSCTMTGSTTVTGNFTELRFYFNVSSYAGSRWSLAQYTPQGSAIQGSWSGQKGDSVVRPTETTYAHPTATGTHANPSAGEYQTSVSVDVPRNGVFNLRIYGVGS